MKEIKVWVEIDSATRDLPSISLLVGTPCDPEISVQQGQIDPVRKTPMPETFWRIGTEVEGRDLTDESVEELVGRLSKWGKLTPEVRAELAPVFRVLVYHDQVSTGVSLPATAVRRISDAGFGLSVVMSQTTGDEED